MTKGLSFDQLYPGTYIKAGEFNGKAVTLTLASVKREMLSNGTGGEEGAVTVSFTETEKQWVMNKTCAVCLRAMWGDDSGEWIGHRVTLHPVKDESGLSESGQCIRVKGSPELPKPLKFRARLGRKMVTQTLVPTGNGSPSGGPAPVIDDETGEVLDFDTEPEDDSAPVAAQDVRDGAGSPNGTTDAFGAESAEDGALWPDEAEDDDVPGMDAAQFAARTARPRSAAAAAQHAAETAAQTRAARPITNKQVSLVYTQCTIHGVDEGEELHEWLGDQLGVAHVTDIPAARLDEVLAWIGEHEKAKGAA